MFTDHDKADLMDVAHALADAARTVTLKYFRTNTLITENKRPADFDPVTQADREAETVMRDILAHRRPNDGIFGEEFGKSAGTSGLTWVLDPIDGTRAYISGIPTWGVLIGLDTGDGPVLGIIDQPYISERYIGGFGTAEMTHTTGIHSLKTRDTKNLEDAILLSTFPEIGTSAERDGFLSVSEKTRLTRYGLDCYGYALLAAGHVDLVIEAGLNAYDVQGPIGVIEAAGGIVTSWDGKPAHMGGRILAAANVDIHAQACAILKEF